MKTKNLLVATFIALALLFAASCSIPDYQLGWEIDDASQPGGAGFAISVPYTISNIGYEKLYDATIRITVDAGLNTYSVWTPQVNLSVGENAYGTATFYVSGTLTIGSEAVTGAGWNAEAKTW